MFEILKELPQINTLRSLSLISFIHIHTLSHTHTSVYLFLFTSMNKGEMGQDMASEAIWILVTFTM
jgi:hypothetical protein